MSSDSVYKLCAEGLERRKFTRKGAADVVYFYRCILWLSCENGPEGYPSVYAYYEGHCYAAVRYILHQLWFPPQQVLFALALARAVKDEAGTNKFVTNDSDVPRALIMAALKHMPINLTDTNKGAVKACTELPASKLSAAWLLRRATMPGLSIALHGDKHTAGWVRRTWISDVAEWEKLLVAGSSYKHMLQSARALLEVLFVFAPDRKEVHKGRKQFVASVEATQRAIGKLQGVGQYVKVHAPRTMLSCELTGEENSTLLRNLPDEWLNQNNSGKAQKAAYAALTDAYTAYTTG